MTKIGVVITSISVENVKGQLCTFAGDGAPIPVVGGDFSEDPGDLSGALELLLLEQFPENEPA